MTTALDLTSVDFDLLVATDLFDAVGCNWDAIGEPACTATAHWCFVCPGGCGKVWLHCARHRAENDKLLAEWSRLSPVYCLVCEPSKRAPLPVPFPWSAI